MPLPMIELIQITADPAMARRCDALAGVRVWVDLETRGKAERQAGRNTFISTHTLDDVAHVKAVLQQAPLMVRLNPLHAGSANEIEAALARGADRLMLPMFTRAAELHTFCRLVDKRVPVTGLLETAGALATLPDWIGTPGLDEVFVGLNDLHLSMGLHFLFEPLARGLLDTVALHCRAQGLRWGFGGMAQLHEGLLPGRDVLAEHLRLGSQAVILSRTFQRPDSGQAWETAVATLRTAEQALALRSPAQVQADRRRIAGTIDRLAADLRRQARA